MKWHGSPYFFDLTIEELLVLQSFYFVAVERHMMEALDWSLIEKKARQRKKLRFFLKLKLCFSNLHKMVLKKKLPCMLISPVYETIYEEEFAGHETCLKKNVFGIPLKKLSLVECTETHKGIEITFSLPRVPLILMQYLEDEDNASTEWILRMCGSCKRVKCLQTLLEQTHDSVTAEELASFGPMVVGSTLKSFFRAIPGSLIPFPLQEKFFSALVTEINNIKDRYQVIFWLCSCLPKLNVVLLLRICRFMNRLAKFEKCNHMAMENLVTSMAPSLLRVHSSPFRFESSSQFKNSYDLITEEKYRYQKAEELFCYLFNYISFEEIGLRPIFLNCWRGTTCSSCSSIWLTKDFPMTTKIGLYQEDTSKKEQEQYVLLRTEMRRKGTVSRYQYIL